jgi:hypothetical protein
VHANEPPLPLCPSTLLHVLHHPTNTPVSALPHRGHQQSSICPICPICSTSIPSTVPSPASCSMQEEEHKQEMPRGEPILGCCNNSAEPSQPEPTATSNGAEATHLPSDFSRVSVPGLSRLCVWCFHVPGVAASISKSHFASTRSPTRGHHGHTLTPTTTCSLQRHLSSFHLTHHHLILFFSSNEKSIFTVSRASAARRSPMPHCGPGFQGSESIAAPAPLMAFQQR